MIDSYLNNKYFLELFLKKRKLIHILTGLKTCSLSLILIDTTAKETTGAVKKKFPQSVLPSYREASLFGHEMEVPRLMPRNDMKGGDPSADASG